MTASHASVLAALVDAERRVAEGTPGPWLDECGGSEGYYVFGPRGIDERFPLRRHRVAAVTYGSHETDKANAGKVVAAVNAYPLSLALVRRIVEEHAPIGPDEFWCRFDADEWPCFHYTLAAAVVGVEMEQP